MGTLYIVATPIGNLEDITLRAVKVLGQVKLLAAEDTRTTRKLMAHYGLKAPTVSFHEERPFLRLESSPCPITPFAMRRRSNPMPPIC